MSKKSEIKDTEKNKDGSPGKTKKSQDGQSSSGDDKKFLPILESILVGDFLTSRFLRRQLGLIILVACFMLVYIYNGYASKKQQIQIAKLKTELDDARYNAITRSSELLEKSRQSRVEQYIRENEDTSIQMATTPPYLIK